MSLKNLNLMIYHADLQPARGIISPGVFFTKKQKKGFNGERGIPGQQKVVCESNVPVLTSHASPIQYAYTKLYKILPVLPTAKSVILTMYKKNIQRKEEKKWQKERQVKTQNLLDWKC